jgi:hypothetical protein
MIKNPLKDINPQTDKLFGIYRGVVEDRVDPDKAGRCKIRVFGVHTSVKRKSTTEGIPTDELPWFEPCLPLIEGSISGFGLWSVPLQGSHVAVYFENGNILQGRYFASLPAIPTESPNPAQGFNDPNGHYPTEHRLNQPDVHRLARGESSETIVDKKLEEKDTGIQIAFGGTWDEPDAYYAAVYPDNIVLSTHGGPLMELDSTNEMPRWHIYHPSNSYIEIEKDGDMIVRNEKDKYEIVIDNKRKHIKINEYCTVDQDRKKKIGNDEQSQIGNNRKEEVGNNEEIEIKNDRDEIVGNNETTDIGSNKTDSIGSNWEVSVGGNCRVTVGGQCDVNVGGVCNVTAATINLN